jgi:hypothetical protein
MDVSLKVDRRQRRGARTQLADGDILNHLTQGCSQPADGFDRFIEGKPAD